MSCRRASSARRRGRANCKRQEGWPSLVRKSGSAGNGGKEIGNDERKPVDTCTSTEDESTKTTKVKKKRRCKGTWSDAPKKRAGRWEDAERGQWRARRVPSENGWERQTRAQAARRSRVGLQTKRRKSEDENYSSEWPINRFRIGTAHVADSSLSLSHKLRAKLKLPVQIWTAHSISK